MTKELQRELDQLRRLSERAWAEYEEATTPNEHGRPQGDWLPSGETYGQLAAGVLGLLDHLETCAALAEEKLEIAQEALDRLASDEWGSVFPPHIFSETQRIARRALVRVALARRSR